MYLEHDSTMVDVAASSVSPVALDPGDLDNLVGKRGSDLVGSDDVCAIWKPPKDPGEIEARIAMSDLEQHPVHDFTHKLSGLISKRSRPVLVVRLQGIDKALKELGQPDAGGLLVVDGETPALHVHLCDLSADALGSIDKPAGLEGEVLM